MQHQIVAHDEWLRARKELLVKEIEFTKLRDAMTAQIRALPWRKIEKNYAFDTSKGKQSLANLFEDKTQLAVYHFMLGLDWDQGCKSYPLGRTDSSVGVIYWFRFQFRFRRVVHETGRRIRASILQLSPRPLSRRRIAWGQLFLSSRTRDLPHLFHLWPRTRPAEFHLQLAES